MISSGWNDLQPSIVKDPWPGEKVPGFSNN